MIDIKFCISSSFVCPASFSVVAECYQIHDPSSPPKRKFAYAFLFLFLSLVWLDDARNKAKARHLACCRNPAKLSLCALVQFKLELELELTQTQMTRKPILRAEA